MVMRLDSAMRFYGVWGSSTSMVLLWAIPSTRCLMSWQFSCLDSKCLGLLWQLLLDTQPYSGKYWDDFPPMLTFEMSELLE